MRALRSRTVQSDSESNEHVIEDSKQHSEDKLSKRNKRKKSKKHTSDSESSEHIMQDFKHITEEFISKKVKPKKSKTHTSDSESNEHIMEDSENTGEATISKKVKRKKLKKHTSDTEGNDHIMEDLEHTAGATLSQKVKPKKSKTHTSDSESNEHIMEDSENTGEASISKKVKRKKLKKHTSDTEGNEHIMKDLEHTAGATLSKKVKVKRSKKYTSDSENNEHIMEDSENTVEATILKKVKRRKSKKHISASENNEHIMEDSENAAEATISKKVKRKKSKKHMYDSESNGHRMEDSDHTAEATISRKDKLKKSKKHLSDSESNEYRMEDSDHTADANISKKLKRKKYKEHAFIKNGPDSDNMPGENVFKEKCRKPREFLRSTILSSPNFDNVVTSTVMKPKRPEIQFEDSEKDEIIENKSSNKINKPSNEINSVIAISDSLEVSKIKENTFNKSNVADPEITSDEEMEIPNRRETFNRLSKSKILNVENTVITISDSPEKTIFKRNTFNKSDTLQPEITSDEDDETSECEMNKIANKTNDSTTLKIFDQSLNRTKDKESLSVQNDTTFKLTDTFCKTPTDKPLRKSEKLCNETNNLSVLEKSKEYEGLSDVSDSILMDIIDISDSTKINRSTFNLSNNTTIKTDSELNKIVNTSGNWQVEKSLDKADIDKQLNGTFDVVNKENDSSNGNSTIIANGSNDTTLKIEHMSLSDKSIRKKWLKFSRNSTDAQTVLDQISSPSLRQKMNESKIVQKIMKTPTDLCTIQKQQIAPSNSSVQKSSINKTPKSIKKSPFKSIKKSVVNGSSTKKGVTKRTAMPNFALIHQKAFDKMENLAEYSARKKERAEKLLSSTKPDSKIKSTTKPKEKAEEPKGKSSRQLFTNDGKHNRFGFKIGDPTKKPTFNFNAKPETHVAIVKPVIKPSVFARTEVVAIANKNKVVTNNKENRRDMLKGVRTNRRFDLLMQMRNK